MKQAAEPFELPNSIKSADNDELGHVNNVTNLRWVQEVAVAHWKAASRPSDQAALRWVVLRHEIDYRQAAYPGDGIIGRTWVGTASRLRFERHTGNLLRASDSRLLSEGTHSVVPDRCPNGQAD